MKEILVSIQAEDFCPDNCPIVSPVRFKDDLPAECLYRSRCKNLWNHLKRREGQDHLLQGKTEVGA